MSFALVLWQDLYTFSLQLCIKSYWFLNFGRTCWLSHPGMQFIFYCRKVFNYWLSCTGRIYISYDHLHAKSLQSCPTVYDPCFPPGSSIHGILQGRILEWVAMIFVTYGLNLHLFCLHESAMDLHVFPIPVPPPASLPIRSLWVFPVHQPWALVSCIHPGLVICFTFDSTLVSILFSQNIPPSPSPTESQSLFCTSVPLFLFCI